MFIEWLAPYNKHVIITALHPLPNGRSSSPVGRLDFKSRWGRQRSLAGSTPVIFRQKIFLPIPQHLQNISILSKYEK